MGFSGEQYVLEKGVYRNCDDWGSGSSALGSLQPVLQVRGGRRSRASWWGGVWSLGGAHFSGGGTRRSKPGAPGGGVSWKGAESTQTPDSARTAKRIRNIDTRGVEARG